MKIIMAILVAIEMLSFPALGDTLENSNKSPKSQISIDLGSIARDQPRIRRIYEWDQQIVVEADNTFSLFNMIPAKNTLSNEPPRSKLRGI